MLLSISASDVHTGKKVWVLSGALFQKNVSPNFLYMATIVCAL